MAAELKLIFEGLDKVKKKIEEGFKSGMKIETKAPAPGFIVDNKKILKDLEKQLLSATKTMAKFSIQSAGIEQNITALNNLKKSIVDKGTKSISRFGKLISKQTKNTSDSLENFSKSIFKNDEFAAINDRLKVFGNINERVTKNMEELSPTISKLEKQIESTLEQIQKQNILMEKPVTPSPISGGKGKGKGAKGKKGMAGLAAIMGGVAGLMMQLVKSTQSVQFILKFIGGLIDALIGPLIPILLSLLKPFLIIFMFLAQFLAKFFMDPVEALKELFTEHLPNAIKDLIGKEGPERQRGAIAGVGAITGAGLGFLVGGPLGALIGTMIGPLVLGWAADLGEWLGKIAGTFTLWLNDFTGGAVAQSINGIIEFFKGLWDIFAGIFTLDWERIKTGFGELFSGLWDITTAPFEAAWEVLSNFGIWIWDKIKSSLSLTWEILKQFGEWIYDKIKTAFVTTWELLSGFGNWIYDKMTSILSTSLNVLSDIGSWIKDKIYGLWKGIKATGSRIKATGSRFVEAGKKIIKGDDMIISPNNTLLSRNPKDYLIATKNPQDLMGNGGGNNINIKIDVKGGIDRTMIDLLKRELRKELSSKGAF